MLTIISIAALGIYAALCELCAHSEKVRGNSVIQVIKGLLKKAVDETDAKSKLAAELSDAEAKSTNAPQA